MKTLAGKVILENGRVYEYHANNFFNDGSYAMTVYADEFNTFDRSDYSKQIKEEVKEHVQDLHNVVINAIAGTM